jgi:hypothetical protein
MEIKDQYYCKICNKYYASINSLSNHRRKLHHDTYEKYNNKSKNNEDNLYYCRFCEDKSYNNPKTRWKHEQKCKQKKESNFIEKILEENKNIKAECDKLKNKVITVQDKLINIKSLATKSFKAVNKVLMDRSYTNNTTNNTNILQIYNIGNENILETMKTKDKLSILNAGHKSFNKLIETVHCGEYEQFKNIIITNIKGDIAYKYESDKGYFVSIEMKDVLDDIFRCRIYDLEEIYNEMNDANKITEKTKQIIKDFIEKCESEDPYVDEYGKKYPNFKEYNKYSIKIILYKSNDKIKKDIVVKITV